MANEEKEGESYLDQLLNDVAPNWEEEGEPDAVLDKNPEDISLDDALAILNDLPDTEEELENASEDDMEELMGLFSDAEAGSVPEEPVVMEEPQVEEEPMALEEPQSEEEPMALEEPQAAEEPGVPEEPQVEEEPMALEEPPAAEEPQEEEGPMALEEPGVPEEFALSDSDEIEIPEIIIRDEDEPDKAEEMELSEDPVAVDDIFQDALSAVGYSGNEDEADEDGEIGDDIFSLDEMAGVIDGAEEGVSTVPVTDPSDVQSSPKKERKPGLLKRLFGNVITDQTAAQEEKERQAELEAKAKKEAAKEEKKQQAAINKEEKAQLAQEAKEQKKIQKAEKAAQKAEKKEEKKRRKAELAEEAAQEVVGKINPVGATIVIIFFVTIGAFTVFGSRLLNRTSSLNNAENYFANGDYMKAYDSICNVSLKEDDEKLYQRIRICSQMQKELDSYYNYTKMQMRLEALDSLLKGIRYYDLNKAEGARVGAAGAMMDLEAEITALLNHDFRVDEELARKLLAQEDMAVYTSELQEIASRDYPPN